MRARRPRATPTTNARPTRSRGKLRAARPGARGPARQPTPEALARLAEHERAFAAGQLLEDRLALRAEALCALEDASGPRESAEFLARYPRSPHAARVREACP
ncbi:MAG: hypothetical protein H6713_16515 [Myxococcales bacterium]|nr:hypothetical protein [Myxococcales bacterium]